MPQHRPRSHSYTGPINGSKPNPALQAQPPPFHPINSVISDEHRAAHNLRVLQRHDPAIRVIHDQIPYAVVRLMKPRGAAETEDEESYWEHQLDGPEGPLFFVEREAESPDARLGFAILNTKDIFSWIQILHREDEIEFSPEMAIIVPSGRQDVMWPALLMKASDGLYAPFIIRLLARCHLLLKYGLEWPDRWKAGQGRLPEQHVPDPQSASHELANKPLRESDLLTMLMVGSKITEIERVAEEIVRVVTAGGTWCRNEYVAPETGWPPEWEEPKGTTVDVWGPVTANHIPEETTTARATLTSSSSMTDPTSTATLNQVTQSASTSDASTIKSIATTGVGKKPAPATNGKKKAGHGASQSQPQAQLLQTPPATAKVLNNDVLSTLLHMPIQPRPQSAELKTPMPSDFNSPLPDSSFSSVPSRPQTDGSSPLPDQGRRRGTQRKERGQPQLQTNLDPQATKASSRRAKAKARSQKRKTPDDLAASSAAESESSMVESGDEQDIDAHPTPRPGALLGSGYSPSHPTPIARTPSFAIVDDRLSDDDEEDSKFSFKTSEPAVASAIAEPEVLAMAKKQPNGKKADKKGKKGKVQLPAQPTPPPSASNLATPPPGSGSGFVKYHQRGYIPQNTDKKPAIDPEIMHDVLLGAIERKAGDASSTAGDSSFPLVKFPVLARNDWVRELLQLIHTDKEFVDGIYTEYQVRQQQKHSPAET
ncbi:hypothetical protein PIIN_09042 [Serendipita indica DSM 11827]|uniref:Uncharacterized protein n=1 Tax=Serendipita indica (strain DSM 11827) TaxID=1109443 RepID=G4TUR4_SERID|nr:hypothetical protein PIIN_09042 [Serendipita indica DSM 11827]